MRTWIKWSVALVAGVLFGATALQVPAVAEDLPVASDGSQCRLHAEVSVERQLRRLSLDLRGRVPSYEELIAVDGLSEVPEATIDAFLDDDSFRLRMRRYHEDLLWPRPSVYLVIAGNNAVGFMTDVGIWRSLYNSYRYRNAPTDIACQDKPQTDIEPNYQLGDYPYCEPQPGKDYCQEGWTWVHPYWGPKQCTEDAQCNDANGANGGSCRGGRCEVKVCAFAAQTLESFDCSHPGVALTDFLKVMCNKNTPTPLQFHCASRVGGGSPYCGAGPNLRWLHRHTNWQTALIPTDRTRKPILDALNEQLLRLVDDYTSGERPYSELLTTRRAHYNGMLMHWRKYLAARLNSSRPYNDYVPEDGDFPEPIDWNSDWQVIERSGVHAGILTLPAYTLRFQTNRGRANRFRIAFRGQYFQPPDVDDKEGCEQITDDLVNRCVCRKCHETLEPLAAHFGAISERGSLMLTGFTKEFATEAECDYQSNLDGFVDTRFCLYLYRETVTSQSDPTPVWRLNALQWADGAPEHATTEKNFDAGPRVMAQEAIDEGVFARATIMNLFRFLFHRDMLLDSVTSDSELNLLDELQKEFEEHDDIKRLTKRLVMLPAYRRTP